MKKYIYKVVFSLTVLLVAPWWAACEDYLDTNNENVIPAHEALQTISDLQHTTAYLYATPWYYFHKQRFVQMSDCRFNNIYTGSTSSAFALMGTFSEANDNTVISHAWASLYNVLAESSYIVNDYVPYCAEQGIGTEADRNVCLGECAFMRALAYWHLAMFWHDVPIVDNPVDIGANAYANRFSDVLVYAIMNAEYAAKWLPLRQTETGRVSRISAWGLLSRLYLTAANYAEGGHFETDIQEDVLQPYYAEDSDWRKTATLQDFFYQKCIDISEECIAQSPTSGYGLMDDYEEIFRVQSNNCREVLFALQFVAGSTTYGICNDQQESYCYDRCIDNNWGIGYLRASYDFILDAIHRGGVSRTRGNIMPSYMTYTYLYHELDTCASKGETWTCGNMSTLPIKKQVVGGPMGTGNISVKGNSGFCTPLLRLSEVYLNLTEAKMGRQRLTSTTDATVLEGVNAVRRRAYRFEIEGNRYRGDYGKTGPFTLDSLLIERRMEFFCEGLSWQDLVRRSFKGEEEMQHMLDYANNKLAESDPVMGCYRLYSYRYTGNSKDTSKMGKVALTTNSAGQYTYSRPSREVVHNLGADGWCHSSAAGVEDNLWSSIYPPSESLQAPNLLERPVAYDFTEILNHKSEYHD